MGSCEICTILPLIQPDFVIYEGRHWLANLREQDQTLLGTTFITAKRHVAELDQLSLQEDREFIDIRTMVIRSIRAAFDPITFNVSCLKNDAFRANPDTTPSTAGHVHWHVKPRYSTKPKQFAGETFIDPLPGRYLDHSLFTGYRPSVVTALAIAETIRSGVHSQLT
jgi:diadenosine tetraphosphate (Ap4A) HIT family hydrolase